EDAVDLGRVDVAATADDHQALAVTDVHEAGVVDEPEVAGVDHAVAERLGGGVVALPVPEHRSVDADPLAGGGGREADLVVDHVHRQVGQRPPTAAGRVRAVGRIDRHHRRRL